MITYLITVLSSRFTWADLIGLPLGNKILVCVVSQVMSCSGQDILYRGHSVM